MPIWEQLGMQAAGDATSGIMGLALGAINDARQRRQQQALQDMQIRGSKEMTDYNMQKQLQMWRNTNYSAQIAEMKKAGINPGLLYGMSGGGGVTTGNPNGSVQGAHAPTGGGEIMGMILGRQMLQAQIENIKADTANKQAEHPNIGTKGEGMKLDNARKEIDNAIAAIDEHIAGKTQNQRIAMYQQETEASMHKLQLLRNEVGVNKERLDAEVGNLWAEMANKAIDLELKEANINLTNSQIRKISAEIWKIGEEIAQGWESLSIQDMKNVLEKSKQDWDQSGLPPMVRDIMGAVGTGVLTGMILNRIPAGQRNQIKGFKIQKP